MQDEVVQDSLSKPEIHDLWISRYRTAENERFFDTAFDVIASELDVSRSDVVLDAGCGSARHTLRLVKRGFRVEAIDFSDWILAEARDTLSRSGLSERVSLRKEDLTNLTYGAESFGSILCWGVLMHIPDASKAIAELCRVTKPGGIVVVGENNAYSLQSRTWRLIERITGRRKRATVYQKPEGFEKWKKYEAGLLLTREFDNHWLIEEFRNHGLQLKDFRARQFTEIFIEVRFATIRKLIHWFNLFWFTRVKAPSLAFGTLLVFQKL
jgi:SAM-dependent methyltransferase